MIITLKERELKLRWAGTCWVDLYTGEFFSEEEVLESLQPLDDDTPF